MVAIRLACDCIGVLERMSDPGIMLFGKTIQLEPNDNVSHAIDAAVVNCEQSLCDHNSINCHKDTASGEGSTDSKHEDGCIRAVLEDQTRCEDKEWSSSKRPKKEEEEEEEEEENETRGPEENPLKKPEKILPCPRCNSMDTKFCYFNNYNLSQPRHFCKNCQRYWTAGGTMRNMPVGAGRRRNKTTNSSSGPRYIVIPNTVYPPFRVNTFASESPLSESITSSLTIEEDPVRAKGGPYFTAPPWPNPWTTLSCHVPIYVMPTYWSCESQPHCPSTSPGASSPLGKHPREEDKRSETKVLVPKTLRFDDPSEAAKSSIWTTLGIKHESTGSLDSGIFFRGLQSKGSHISSGYEISSVLQANPAAMSRSLTYHESVE